MNKFLYRTVITLIVFLFIFYFIFGFLELQWNPFLMTKDVRKNIIDSTLVCSFIIIIIKEVVIYIEQI